MKRFLDGVGDGRLLEKLTAGAGLECRFRIGDQDHA